ncbi:GNAT family N-acetyltransferase [Morganella morganii]|uniref:GNAT family N-acetyltransferase n=1 Tax=Morganella morganii TaxID=582 RepID=UPI0028108F82|nr:GNAT family N-acetyltransferase [Morganella morganii]ELT0452973.1 GNAT family N-acetyltransferase [Morganella morganii]HDU8695018.1 GNAT family N-acetyltransferase [Morganella morganii subsp. morganii]
MAQITDPSNALSGFQLALDSRGIHPKKCMLHTDLYTFTDEQNGVRRYTYAHIENGIAKGIVMFVTIPKINKTPSLGIGYAVMKSNENQGIATRLVKKSIDEIKSRFSFSFYLQAIIDANNIASQKVALKTLPCTPVKIIEQQGNMPAYDFTFYVDNNKK